MNVAIAKLPKLPLRVAVPISAILAIAIAVFSIPLIRGNQPSAVSATDSYKNQLRGQVDTATGAPRNGRDPASQPQNSLATAASSPSGTGGSNTTSTTNSNSASAQQDGLGTNGCYIDYGIQGQECLPAHAATDGVLTCEGVRNHGFPGGIKVTGTDRYNLDTNHDRIACDSGDN